jgi:TolB-like protein/Tfp pilus assembly protein PilF
MEVDDLIDVRPLLSQVKTPTLVIHCDRDQAVAPDAGRLLAARIPGARYVSLPSANHLMLETEPAWARFVEELDLFLNVQAPPPTDSTISTRREPAGHAVCFDRFRFDVETGRLWSGARELRLTPKASALLAMLVTRAGQPISKEELFASVWAGTIVSDDALTSCVQELRRALEDDAKQPRFIETRHRRGYRFLAPISHPTTADRTVHAAPAPPDITSIAVLPFADMSPDRDLDYLCEGFAEELINALTQVEGLRVAARMASFQFRSSGADVREVGRQLGVGTLLEGSVRKADHHLRVTVQLIEVASGYHRWSQRFDRTLDDVFAIEDEIAESVARSLRGSVAGLRQRLPRPRPQSGVEAYEFYLRGRQYLSRMTEPDLAKSAEMFEQALELDPDYSPALASLGAVHATLYEWFGAKEEDLIRADRVTRRAMALAPELAEPHEAMGFVLSLSGRYGEAAREFEEAIRLNPYSFEAHYYFARSCFAAGDVARSAELFRKAAEVRKEDFQSSLLLAQSLRMMGRRREAQEAQREGIRRAERVLALNPLDARALSLGSIHLLQDGQPERAMEWSRRSIELYPDHMTTLVCAACFYSQAGDRERSLEFLERLFARGWGKRDWVEHDPDYDILRDHPRFQELVARLK